MAKLSQAKIELQLGQILKDFKFCVFGIWCSFHIAIHVFQFYPLISYIFTGIEKNLSALGSKKSWCFKKFTSQFAKFLQVNKNVC